MRINPLLLAAAACLGLSGCAPSANENTVLEEPLALAAVMSKGYTQVSIRGPLFYCDRSSFTPTAVPSALGDRTRNTIGAQTGAFFTALDFQPRTTVRGVVCFGARKPARVLVFPPTLA